MTRSFVAMDDDHPGRGLLHKRNERSYELVNRQPTKYELHQRVVQSQGVRSKLWKTAEKVEELRHKAAAQDTVKPTMKVQSEFGGLECAYCMEITLLHCNTPPFWSRYDLMTFLCSTTSTVHWPSQTPPTSPSSHPQAPSRRLSPVPFPPPSHSSYSP